MAGKARDSELAEGRTSESPEAFRRAHRTRAPCRLDLRRCGREVVELTGTCPRSGRPLRGLAL